MKSTPNQSCDTSLKLGRNVLCQGKSYFFLTLLFYTTLCGICRYSKAGMQMVKLSSMNDWETLPVTSWGIKQPRLKDERDDALETGM